MMRARALGFVALVTCFGAACGSTKSSGSSPGVGGGGGISLGSGGKANGAAGSSASAGTSIGVNAGASNAGAPGGPDSCVEAKQEAKLAPLDIFMMLDISSSMLDRTGSRANAPTKWEAVSSALKAFLTDPASNGLGVGIQYFPLRDPSVPMTCTSDSECGSHGPCFLKFCRGAAGFVPCARDQDCLGPDQENFGPCAPLRFCSPLDSSGDLQGCHDISECGRGQTCELFNECSNDRNYVCTTPGQMCRSQQGTNLGVCTTPESFCVHQASCSPAVYAAPAAPIAPLPANANTLVRSIDAQMPDGQTPTAPALRGALQSAASWAQAHPDHSVVALLATDGLPTECVANPETDASGISEVQTVASAGASASPSVLTFVIGVFGPTDTEARPNLDQIAIAGGTKKAFLVDTSLDVTAQFVAALNEIRGSHLACEYSLPAAPQGQSLDYNKVNVDFTNGGANERIAQVKDATACGTADGWYYDADPRVANPTRIMICPSTCDRLQSATMGSVQVALGCATVVR